MADYELASLVDAYWREYAQRDEREDSLDDKAGIDWPVWFRVDRMLRDDVVGELFGVADVDLLIGLAEGAPGEDALAYLGAGAIEDYLCHGTPDIDAVDTAARQSRKFRIALTCAWFDRHIDPADAERLRRFGPPP